MQLSSYILSKFKTKRSVTLTNAVLSYRHFNALCSVLNTLFPFTSFITDHSPYHFTIGSYITQTYTNPGRQVVRATTFCTVAPKISGSSAWNLRRVNYSGVQNAEVVSRLLENL